jgi:hypothetical protein
VESRLLIRHIIDVQWCEKVSTDVASQFGTFGTPWSIHSTVDSRFPSKQTVARTDVKIVFHRHGLSTVASRIAR